VEVEQILEEERCAKVRDREVRHLRERELDITMHEDESAMLVVMRTERAHEQRLADAIFGE
jgi:hypothetical protein